MKFDILEESGVSILSLEDPILYFENEGNNALQSTGMYSFIPQSVLRQAHSLCQSVIYHFLFQFPESCHFLKIIQ